jgi:hypothetical protein
VVLVCAAALACACKIAPHDGLLPRLEEELMVGLHVHRLPLHLLLSWALDLAGGDVNESPLEETDRVLPRRPGMVFGYRPGKLGAAPAVALFRVPDAILAVPALLRHQVILDLLLHVRRGAVVLALPMT